MMMIFTKGQIETRIDKLIGVTMREDKKVNQIHVSAIAFVGVATLYFVLRAFVWISMN